MKKEGTWKLPPWMRMSIPKAVMVYGAIFGIITTVVIALAFPYVLEPGNIRVWYLPAFITACMVVGGLGASYIDLELILRSNVADVGDRHWSTTGSPVGVLVPELEPMQEGDEERERGQEPTQYLPEMEFVTLGGVRFLAEYGKGSEGAVIGEGPICYSSSNSTNSGADHHIPYEVKFIRHDEIAGAYVASLVQKDWFQPERPDGSGGSPLWLKLGFTSGFVRYAERAGDLHALVLDIVGVHGVAREWAADLLDELEIGPKGQRLRELLDEVRGTERTAKIQEELMKRFDGPRVSNALYGMTRKRRAYFDQTAAKLQIARLESRMKYITAENQALWTVGRSHSEMVKEMTKRQLEAWSHRGPESSVSLSENPRIPERKE